MLYPRSSLSTRRFDNPTCNIIIIILARILLQFSNYFPYLDERHQNAVFTSNSFVLEPSPWVVLCVRK
jgi:hypothetical protein